MISPIHETYLTNDDLVDHMKDESKVLRSSEIEAAFREIDRARFVRNDYLAEAYEDCPLPIGEGQTISQPSTVAFMLELLGASRGEEVLDVGSGSGWTTALLATLVGPEGKVFGVERLPDLVAFGRKNIAKFDVSNASIEEAGKGLGKPDAAPFDRILVSAAAEGTVPKALISQLNVGGVLVIPVGEAILRVVKKSEKELEQKAYEGFSFVPLVEKS